MKKYGIASALVTVLAVLGLYTFLPKTNIVFEGDSLTVGAYLLTPEEQSYPAQTLSMLDASVWSKVVAANGETTVQISEQGKRQVDSSAVWGARNIVVVWMGTNDIIHSEATPDQIYQNIKSYCLARKKSGFKVIILSMLPASSDPHKLPADYKIRQSEVNTLLQKDHTFADAFVDLGIDPRLQDENDTRYFIDRLHLSPEGYKIVAEFVVKALDTIASR